VLPNDFPDWFSEFVNKQLADVPIFQDEQSYDINDLSISYIRLWSVFEIYIKILVRLNEKRSAKKKIDARINQAEKIASNLKDWVANARIVSSKYEASIQLGKAIDIEKNIGKFTGQIKPISVDKFTVRKSDISSTRLPSAKDIEKACAEFSLNCSELTLLLKPTNSESKFYKTRNTIAHEGRSDIQERNFLAKRINPLRSAVDAIERHLSTTINPAIKQGNYAA